MTILEIINYSIGAIGLFIAIYQTRKMYTIEQHAKAEVMATYSTVAILLGKLQMCQESLKNNNTNLIMQHVNASEGMAQTFLVDSVRHIHSHYNFTRNDVDEWIKHKKIHDYHKDLFLKF